MNTYMNAYIDALGLLTMSITDEKDEIIEAYIITKSLSFTKSGKLMADGKEIFKDYAMDDKMCVFFEMIYRGYTDSVRCLYNGSVISNGLNNRKGYNNFKHLIEVVSEYMDVYEFFNNCLDEIDMSIYEEVEVPMQAMMNGKKITIMRKHYKYNYELIAEKEKAEKTIDYLHKMISFILDENN